jgi:hypothetical protein
MTKIVKVISGGQTGADQGGLVAARTLKIETGGTAAKGWLTEDGPKRKLLQSFGLVECEEDGYPARTHKNAADGDVTIWIGRTDTPGFKCTASGCRKAKRNEPYLIPLEYTDKHLRKCVNYLRNEFEGNIIVNVAGNRESKTPGIYRKSEAFMLLLLRHINFLR